MLQTVETIVPFWHRLRAIVVYPLRGEALLTISVLAVCRLFTLLPISLLSLLVGVVIWVAVYRYAFEVLRASANGSVDPPAGGLKTDDSIGWAAIRLQTGFILLAALGFIMLGPVGGIACAVLLAFGQPGAMMSLAMDENVLHALNPATWLQIMGRIGWPYVLAVGLCFVINASISNAMALFAPFMPYMVALVVSYFFAHYVTIATFHLMGYLIYQYHHELGYEVDRPVAMPSMRRADADPDQPLLDQAAQLVRDGKAAEAQALLRAQIADRGASEGVHAQYRKLVRLADDRPELLAHGQRWLAVLLAQEKFKRAVDLYRECSELDPAFVPNEAEQFGVLAEQCARLGQSQAAIRLLSGFHKRFPKSRDIPRNYLLAARLLHEKLGQDAQARSLLLQLQQAYPQHELKPQIDALLESVDSILAAKPAALAAPGAAPP